MYSKIVYTRVVAGQFYLYSKQSTQTPTVTAPATTTPAATPPIVVAPKYTGPLLNCYANTQISSSTKASLADCQSECNNKAGCQHVMFSVAGKYQNNNCILAQTTQLNPICNTQALSGTPVSTQFYMYSKQP